MSVVEIQQFIEININVFKIQKEEIKKAAKLGNKSSKGILQSPCQSDKLETKILYTENELDNCVFCWVYNQ